MLFVLYISQTCCSSTVGGQNKTLGETDALASSDQSQRQNTALKQGAAAQLGSPYSYLEEIIALAKQEVNDASGSGNAYYTLVLQNSYTICEENVKLFELAIETLRVKQEKKRLIDPKDMKKWHYSDFKDEEIIAFREVFNEKYNEIQEKVPKSMPHEFYESVMESVTKARLAQSQFLHASKDFTDDLDGSFDFFRKMVSETSEFFKVLNGTNKKRTEKILVQDDTSRKLASVEGFCEHHRKEIA